MKQFAKITLFSFNNNKIPVKGLMDLKNKQVFFSRYVHISNFLFRAVAGKIYFLILVSYFVIYQISRRDITVPYVALIEYDSILMMKIFELDIKSFCSNALISKFYIFRIPCLLCCFLFILRPCLVDFCFVPYQ